MRNDVWIRLGVGAAAGLAGTMAIQALLKTHQKISPESMPPINEAPGKFMIRKVKDALPQNAREKLPQRAEAIGENLLGLGYGVAFGAIYGVARPKWRRRRLKTQRVLLEGALLGVAAWAIGYLGWLPAAKLMPPLWKQKPAQVAMPIAEHALYGLATVAGYRWLRERVGV